MSILRPKRVRRKWVLLLIATPLLVWATYLWQQSAARRAAYHRIEMGMPYGEVEKLLGRPTKKSVNPLPSPLGPVRVIGWDDGATYIEVWTDDAKTVCEKSYTPQPLSYRLEY